MKGRILGTSKTTEVSTRTLFLSSGNNVGPILDMTRRCITINLDPRCEMPATRTFDKPDLLQVVRAQRGMYVSAALTLMRAWVVAGRPKAACKSVASFNDWSELCRQPLLWLGLTDPAQSIFDGLADDPDRQILGRLQTAWHAKFGDEPTMVRDLVEGASRRVLGSDDDLEEVLIEIAGERAGINRRGLGRWIQRHVGQIVDGLRIAQSPVKRNSMSWVVESVLSVRSIAKPHVYAGVSGHPIPILPPNPSGEIMVASVNEVVTAEL